MNRTLRESVRHQREYRGRDEGDPMKYYLLQIVDDIEPQVHGPYPTIERRDQVARELKALSGDRDGLFPMTISIAGFPDDITPEVEIGSYSNAFFDAEAP